MTDYSSQATTEEASLVLAQLWANLRSKDPSTKVGAVIIDPRTGGLFFGYNGFPAGVPDRKQWWDNREDLGVWGYTLTKYDLVIHAETNAVRKALMGGVDLKDATLVCTHLPCPECMKNVVLANGIKRVVYGNGIVKMQSPKAWWLVKELAEVGGVELVEMKPEVIVK